MYILDFALILVVDYRWNTTEQKCVDWRYFKPANFADF